MGEPKFARPKFDTPSHPWKAERIEEEHAIQKNHGLKNMREIWKSKSQLRRHRRQAMRLIGMADDGISHSQREKDDLIRSLHGKGLIASDASLDEKDDLIRSLHGKGLIASDASLDDILSLGTEDILNRRLQAQVYYKGLASTMKQARQLVTHGHICVGDQKVTIPHTL